MVVQYLEFGGDLGSGGGHGEWKLISMRKRIIQGL